MANELALTINQRTALSSLRTIDHYLTRTERRLATGKDINGIVDGPLEYFIGRNLSRRASDYLRYVDQQEQAIQTLEATLEALETVDKLIDNMLSIVRSARTQSTALRQQSSANIAETLRQINLLVTETQYLGTNLLTDANNTLRVQQANEKVSYTPTGATADVEKQVGFYSITAYDLRDTTDGLFTGTSFLNVANLDTLRSRTNLGKLGLKIAHTLTVAGSLPPQTFTFSSLTQMGTDNALAGYIVTKFEDLAEGAKEQIEQIGLHFGNSIALMTERIAFSREYSDTLQIGSDKVILADMNEEGANLTALRTRNQINIETLSIASQQIAAVLTLLQ